MAKSSLSTRILLQLRREPAASMTALASLIKATRSSVSRAVNEMIKQSLIQKDGRRLLLTPMGIDAARTIERGLPDEIAKAGKTLARLADQMNVAGMSPSFGSIFKDVLRPSEIMSSALSSFEALKTMQPSPDEVLKRLPSPEKIRMLLPPSDFTQILPSIMKTLSPQIPDFSKILPHITKDIQASFATFSNSISAWLDDIHGKLKELGLSEAVIKPIFEEAGLWISPSMMNLGILLGIKRLHNTGELTPQTLLSLILKAYRASEHELLRETVAGWFSNPIFARRQHILEASLGMHIAQKFTVSIPAALAQVEGVSCEIMREDKGPKQTVPDAVKEWKSDLLPTLASDILSRYLQNMVYQQVKKLDKSIVDTALNRHGILHGEILSYASEENSLRVFLMLDVLSVPSTKDDGAEAGVED